MTRPVARPFLFGSLTLGTLLLVSSIDTSRAQAQSGTKDVDANAPTFAEQVWGYLKESEYQSKWMRWPKDADGFTEGKSPHGAFLKVYINEIAAKNPAAPGIQSIVIKENYNEKKELVSVTPMVRVGKDYDPDHNDWFYAKYKPNGKLFMNEDNKISGKVQSCIDCHAKAGGDDYLFTND